MPKSKKRDFENTLQNLEELVSQLETGDLSLDSSLKKFEEGVEMYNECKGFLIDADKKIQVLTESLKEEEYSEE